MAQERILLIDDDEGLLHLLTMRLTAMGFHVSPCATGNEALRAARNEVFDLAITDLRLMAQDGLDVMDELLLIHPMLPVLILTAHGSIPNAVEAMQRGAYGYLTKPFEHTELSITIQKALDQQLMRRQCNRLKLLVKELHGLENVIAASHPMQALLQQVVQVADTNATICISGETGPGKEVIARVIHCNSRRAREPFVAINCGAIPESLFESELFGHIKGAFTGAYESKRGLLQTADKGTLFLDEIGELPLSMQGKLLRTLQEREVHPVGCALPVKVNLRIIAATNKDLGSLVKKGIFREDLYYRIHVVPLTVPPLRERRADIPLLAELFLKLNAQRMNKEIHGFLPQAMQKLMLSPWRGNVRELENAIEKAVVMATQDMISADLISYLDHMAEGQLKPLTEAREEFERGYLKEVLEFTRGNISRAALIAGRYRADFYKLLKKYRLHPADAKNAKLEKSGTPMSEDRPESSQ
jgi:two-component system response regulator GlrR